MASTDDGPDVASSGLPRAFVDSSVLFAAARSEVGAAFGLIQAAYQGLILLLASVYVLSEVERNLIQKTATGVWVFREHRALVQLVDPTPELVAEIAHNIEPKDAAIVAGAVAGRADYLVTYDRRHLLSHAELIRQLYRVEAIEPRDMLNIVRGRS